MRHSSRFALPVLVLAAAVTFGGIAVSPARADDDVLRVKPPGVGVDGDRGHDMNRDHDRTLRERDDTRSGSSVPPAIIDRDDKAKRDHDRDKVEPMMRHDLDRDGNANRG